MKTGLFLVAMILLSGTAFALSRDDITKTINDLSDFTWNLKHGVQEFIDNANRNTVNLMLGQLVTAIPFVIVCVILITTFMTQPQIAIGGILALFVIWYFLLPLLGI